MKTRPPSYAASYLSLDEFLSSCAEWSHMDPLDYFIQALGNKIPRNRVEITSWMLDNGIPASYVDPDPRGRYNALHILFAQREHDYELEAPLLRRLLKEGADINGYAPRMGRPLQGLLENNWIREKDLGPFYDVIFAHPGIDWNVPASFKNATEKFTLREAVDRKINARPEMIRRMHHYLAHGPTPEPGQP